MRANKWMTSAEAKAFPKDTVMVARVMKQGAPAQYILSTNYNEGFDPDTLDGLDEFMQEKSCEVHFLLIDEAPNEAC